MSIKLSTLGIMNNSYFSNNLSSVKVLFQRKPIACQVNNNETFAKLLKTVFLSVAKNPNGL